MIADRTEFWWNERKPEERTLWQSKIELSEKFFKESPSWDGFGSVGFVWRGWENGPTDWRKEGALRSSWGKILLSGVVAALVATVISSWMHDRSSILSAKRDVLRRFLGNRYVLTSVPPMVKAGEPFVALNEIFVVYAEHPQVIAALKKMHEELGEKGRLVDNILTLTKAMAEAVEVPIQEYERRVHFPAFHPGKG